MRFEVKAGTEMTPSLLGEYIQKHKTEIQNRNDKLQAAYENRYEIFDRKVNPAKPSWKPDNRICVNFAKYIVDTFVGFFCGIPVKVTSDSEVVSEYLDFLHKYNDQEHVNTELAKNTDIHGNCHEVYFNDETGELGVLYALPTESFFLVDDSMLHRELYFVRYYRDSEGVERGSWSDNAVIQYFDRNPVYRWDGPPQPHHFGGIPATEFSGNEERLGLFESAMPAINAYNKALSEKANDVDAFADAYLKVLGATLTDENLRHMRSSRVVNFEGDVDKLPDVGFLERPNGDGVQENLLDRLEDKIFTQSMVANISDENFAGDSSGVAIRYKLQAMENLFGVKKQRFISAMNRRYRLLFSNPVAQTHGVHPEDWLTLSYRFTPNYPANLADEASTAQNLAGIVSRETQLATLSCVNSVEKELARLEEEETDLLERARDRSMGDDSQNEDG